MDLGVTVDRKLKFHSHIHRKVNAAGAVTTDLLSSTLCRDRNFLLNLYVTYIRPQLEYASTLWNTGYLGDCRLLERIQRRWTRQIEGLEDLPNELRIKELDLYSIYGRLLRAELIQVWKIFHGKCALRAEDLFVPSPSASTRGHNLKVHVQFARLDIRKRSFAHRVVTQWNALSPEAVNANTVEKFKFYIHRELGDKLYHVV